MTCFDISARHLGTLRIVLLPHSIFHTPLCHTALSHTTFHTQLSHTRSFTQNFVTYTIFFVAHHLSHTTLSRTTLHIQLVLLFDPPPHPLSFLPVPATTFVAHYWKKLTCGVIRSFNFREINYFDWAIFNSYVKLPDCIGFLPSTAGFRKQNHQRRLGQSETNTAIWWKELLGDG